MRFAQHLRQRYGPDVERLKRLSAEDIHRANRVRVELFADLAGRVKTGYRGTKLDVRRLAPGCEACGRGSWSCLFINGRCNGRCFYCPAPQNSDDLPVTQTLPFASPGSYADYVQAFGFDGVSFSGGEPLLSADLTLDFLTAVRRRLGDRVHTWMYTNGTLVTKRILERFRDAGLDEIRFDIGATRYHLKKARLAVDLIPTVTVEIPAVPEDEELMRAKMREMADAGIRHLNLHQLRLTPHNMRHLSRRDYTYISGRDLTVLESEWTALRLIRFGLDEGIDLPVNYCSYVYKQRYQKAAARARGARRVANPYESVTEGGYLKRVTVRAAADRIGGLDRSLRDAGHDPALWQPSSTAEPERIWIHESLLGAARPFAETVVFEYYDTVIRSAPSYYAPFTEVPLPSGGKLYVEKVRVGEGFSRDPALESIEEGLQVYC
ncbi:radical SAM protein [bacterium]|nr:radical SAM protein [bacterium]